MSIVKPSVTFTSWQVMSWVLFDIGVTSDLVKRVSEHREKTRGGLTAKYNVQRLVYYEEFGSIMLAIEREKALKGWHRQWKIRLIEKNNPKWADLFSELAR